MARLPCSPFLRSVAPCTRPRYSPVQVHTHAIDLWCIVGLASLLFTFPLPPSPSLPLSLTAMRSGVALAQRFRIANTALASLKQMVEEQRVRLQVLHHKDALNLPVRSTRHQLRSTAAVSHLNTVLPPTHLVKVVDFGEKPCSKLIPQLLPHGVKVANLPEHAIRLQQHLRLPFDEPWCLRCTGRCVKCKAERDFLAASPS